MKYLPLALLLVFLSACSGDVYARAYTASGDGMTEAELSEDEQFNTTDDLNVVIKLNRRSEAVQVTARFIDPNGEVLEAIDAEAPQDVGTLVMGIDFQARADQINQWLRGRYRVEIVVDGEVVDTLFFRVD